MKDLTSISVNTGILSAIILAISTPVQAYSVFFAEDINDSAFTPLASYPNAQNAENQFLSNLVGVGTETFESFTSGTTQPLNITFPGSSGSISATLSGGNGSISSVTPGTTNGFGRYAISGSNYWEVEAGGSGNFEVNFNQAVAAFGFYGVDIGDFGGQLELELTNGTTTTVTVNNTIGSIGSTDGSVLFYGLIADNLSETFTKVSFLTSTGQGDVFAFDNLTVGDINQTCANNPELCATSPEPASMLGLLVVSSLGLGSLKRKQK